MPRPAPPTAQALYALLSDPHLISRSICFELLVVTLSLVPQGKQLNHNISGGVIIANQSLVLQGVSRASAGNYTCVGFNQEGEGVSNSFYLNVMCEYQSLDWSV